MNVLEFQVVGAPILEDQLTDVKSTLQAIATANGACSLDSWMSNLHRFERIQISLWGSRQGQESTDAVREAESRERQASERELANRQILASVEHECEQLRKERDSAQKGVQDLQSALDERSRQAENWRTMYESLKSGGRVTMPPPMSLTSMPVSRSLTLASNHANSNFGNNAKIMRTSQPASLPGGHHYSHGSQENMIPENSYGFSNGADVGGGMSRFRSSSIMSGDSNVSGASHGGVDMRGIPTRSHTTNPILQRPPTRDQLSSLLNRSIVPRTQNSFTSNGRSLGPPPSHPPQLSEPVRSTFFTPAALRAASPAPMQGQGYMSRPAGQMQY